MKKLYNHIILLFAVLFLFIACNDTKRNKTESVLLNAYQRLALTKYGLDYPAYRKEIELSKKNNGSTYKTYMYVQEGKKFLLSQIASDPDRTLQFTLDVICTQCEKDYEQFRYEDEEKYFKIAYECYGAVVALFFFDKEDQDRIILNRFKTVSNRVFDAMVTTNYEWIHNRPDPEIWINALKKLNRFDQKSVERFIKNLKTKLDDEDNRLLF